MKIFFEYKINSLVTQLYNDIKFEMMLYQFHQAIVNASRRKNNELNEAKKEIIHTNAGTNRRLNAASRASSSADD